MGDNWIRYQEIDIFSTYNTFWKSYNDIKTDSTQYVKDLFISDLSSDRCGRRRAIWKYIYIYIYVYFFLFFVASPDESLLDPN